MTTAGEIAGELPLASELADPFDLTLGPDGALRFTQGSLGQIGRLDVDHPSKRPR